MSGNTRNITQVTLPEKTKSYIYRISISPKGKSSVDNSLFELLEQMGGAQVAIATSFAKFAIKNNDNPSVDAFIFNNTYDADNFYSKNDGNWNPCKSMTNRVSCCFSTKECIGKQIYFGFRNNNMMEGLDVKLEIVALVDSSLKSDYKHSYTILNTTDREQEISISLDNKNWKSLRLREGYQQILSYDENEIFFKISTSLYKVAAYKLAANDRYKIIWNSSLQKWDLTRF